jgi:hypothetical protein
MTACFSLETPDDGYQLISYDPKFEARVKAAEEEMA